MTALSPTETAQQVRDAMLVNDRATRMMGIVIREVGPGSAIAEMRVRPDMLNGHDICHGGFVATLADTAFAFACNAYNEVSVASSFAIELLAASREGDVLSADCVEVSKGGRSGLYDATVSNQRGERVAMFRGRSYTARGKPVTPL